MKLVVFGDSHTAGSEIDNQYSLQCYEKSFVKKIADYFQCDYENYSVAGASNCYIATEAYKYIDSHDVQDCFFFISWGAARRATIYDYNKKDFLHINEYDIDSPYYNSQQKNFIENYFNFHLPDKEEEWKILGTILGLYNYLCYNKINFLMQDSTQAFAHWHNKYFYKNNYFGLDDPTTYWHQYEIWRAGSKYNTDRWAKHAPEQWHEIWAEKILQHIREQQLV